MSADQFFSPEGDFLAKRINKFIYGSDDKTASKAIYDEGVREYLNIKREITFINLRGLQYCLYHLDANGKKVYLRYFKTHFDKAMGKPPTKKGG